MPIPTDRVEEVLFRCGRHCCICRRFRPTLLQVHHIEEQASGGSDELDNLIAVCLSCHVDIHTHVPFARRFTHDELKRHRERVYEMVAKGTLVGNDNEASAAEVGILRGLLERGSAAGGLSTEAIRLLAAGVKGGGDILSIATMGGRWDFGTGGSDYWTETDARRIARFKAALQELVGTQLIEQTAFQRGAEVYEVTDRGYTFYDDMLASEASGR